MTWIGPHEPEVAPQGRRPAFWLRTEFDVQAETGTARLRLSARGMVEVFVNGIRIGDELLPGFTQYSARLPLREYEVTHALREGPNAIAVLLADGWFRGQTNISRSADQWGTTTSVWAEIVSAAGTLIGTGEGWRTRPSHVLAADLMEGQTEDRRRSNPAVLLPGFDDTDWSPATIADPPEVPLVPYDAPPVRRISELRPVSVVERAPGVHIVDLGRNINGWLRVSNLGPAGTELTLHHGEWLTPDGDLDVSNLTVELPILPAPLGPSQIDRVISAGIEGDVFEPRLTTHGFQYIRIEGHPGSLTVDDVTGIAVHTDLDRLGTFTCDDDRLNRFHDAAVWSLLGNACEIPTDCPQRERAGWTGDWQLFVPTAAFLFDVEAFTRKWLADVRADQRADGAIANISPSNRAEGFDGYLGPLNGSAGWGDVIVMAPWALYQAYGTTAALAESWDAMAGWVGFGAERARTARSTMRTAANATQLPHEQHLWDTGFHWGEWLEPDADLIDFRALMAAEKSEVATAYLHRSAAVMASIGGVLGKPDDTIAYYEQLAANTKDAWQREFIAADGSLAVQTQAGHVRALAFGLVPDDLRQQTADRLAELVRAAGVTVGTGFLSTPMLLPVLADHGHLDLAYELLRQPNVPGWLAMIDRGATTVWEHWNGVDRKGRISASLNHYSKGAVISFLHRYTAGLTQTTPGYATFDVTPRPGGGIGRVDQRLQTPHGEISIAWQLTDGMFDLTVHVPAGTSTTVCLPDERRFSVTAGEHHWSCPA